MLISLPLPPHSCLFKNALGFFFFLFSCTKLSVVVLDFFFWAYVYVRERSLSVMRIFFFSLQASSFCKVWLWAQGSSEAELCSHMIRLGREYEVVGEKGEQLPQLRLHFGLRTRAVPNTLKSYIIIDPTPLAQHSFLQLRKTSTQIHLWDWQKPNSSILFHRFLSRYRLHWLGP